MGAKKQIFVITLGKSLLKMCKVFSGRDMTKVRQIVSYHQQGTKLKEIYLHPQRNPVQPRPILFKNNILNLFEVRRIGNEIHILNIHDDNQGAQFGA